MTKGFYSRQTATDMAYEAWEIFAKSGIDARFSVDICIDPNKEMGSEYYLCVSVRELGKESSDFFYPDSYDLSGVRDAVDAIRRKQTTQPEDTDTDLLRRMFPNSPMEDIDRLMDIVKGWKGGSDE